MAGFAVAPAVEKKNVAHGAVSSGHTHHTNTNTTTTITTTNVTSAATAHHQHNTTDPATKAKAPTNRRRERRRKSDSDEASRADLSPVAQAQREAARIKYHCNTITGTAPPCAHNSWDNVRVIKKQVTLRCRECQVQWRAQVDAAWRSRKCSVFQQPSGCPYGAACTKIHMHAKKLSMGERVLQQLRPVISDMPVVEEAATPPSPSVNLTSFLLPKVSSMFENNGVSAHLPTPSTTESNLSEFTTEDTAECVRGGGGHIEVDSASDCRSVLSSLQWMLKGGNGGGSAASSSSTYSTPVDPEDTRDLEDLLPPMLLD